MTSSHVPEQVGFLCMWAEQLKGHLDALLLATLEHEPLHGYAITDRLRERSGGVFDLPSGTVYPALHRLEEAALIASDWSMVAGRRRRTYRLTGAGRDALERQRRAWQRFATAASSLLGDPA
jgi:DNA-binding PadR family transcriptional regulator